MHVFDDRVIIANDILKKLGCSKILQNVEEINSNLFLLFYRLLFNGIPDGVKENDKDEDQEICNIHLLLECLSINVLHVSLDHIDVNRVVAKDPSTVMNVLEIFQGLVDCLKGQKNKKHPHRINSDGERLRRTIEETNRQVDNLTMMAKQTIQGPISRDVYLQKKIQELLEMRGGGLCLRDYVDDHNDELVLTKQKYSKRSTSTKKVGHASSQRFSGEVSARSIGTTGVTDMEDDLTMITRNECDPALCADDTPESDVSHGSKDTYLLTSRTMDADPVPVSADLERERVVKDAWAQVSKEMIRDGYEHEFLDMLLQEDSGRGGKNSQRGCTTDEDSRILSAYENHRGTRRPRSSRFKRSHGGLLHPVVKQIGHVSDRSVTGSLCASGIARSAPVSVDGDGGMVTRLLREFPALSLSEQSLRQMWLQAARQSESIQRSQQEFVSRPGVGEQRVEDARRRQQLLLSLLRREAVQQTRAREQAEAREAAAGAKAAREAARQRSARARRYYDEFSLRMRARMLQKQAGEERVFRAAFAEALRLQRERANEVRRYARDKKQEAFSRHRDDLDSLENYYRDRFSMLAECLRDQRRRLDMQDRSQEQALARDRAEARRGLEGDVRRAQEALVSTDHEAYFRQLDAGTALASVARQ